MEISGQKCILQDKRLLFPVYITMQIHICVTIQMYTAVGITCHGFDTQTADILLSFETCFSQTQPWAMFCPHPHQAPRHLNEKLSAVNR